MLRTLSRIFPKEIQEFFRNSIFDEIYWARATGRLLWNTSIVFKKIDGVYLCKCYSSTSVLNQIWETCLKLFA